MSHEHENYEPQELKLVEQALTGLVPVPPRVDRDRLMFLAGAASAGRDLASGRREPPDGVNLAERKPIGKLTHPARPIWLATTVVLGSTSLALAIALLNRPTPVERIVYRDHEVLGTETQPRAFSGTQPQAIAGTPQRAPATASGTAAIPADNYVRTREVALRLGLDALGNWPSGGSEIESPAPTVRSLLESLSPAAPRRPGPTNETSQM